MKAWNWSDHPEKNRGSYTIEAALTLTIFTICVMAIISVISIIKVEGEVQDALNETALELSQYTYTYGKFVKVDRDGSSVYDAMKSLGEATATEDWGEALPNLVLSIARDGSKKAAGNMAGAALSQSLVKGNFSRENVNQWLVSQGVVGGYEGLDFSSSSLLCDGKTIDVSVVYQLKIQAYGLFDKTLTLRQRAKTYALLPVEVSALFSEGNGDGDGTDSIWKESNFVRGKYFLKEIRSANSGQEVKSGSGIDLYDSATGHYVEAVSINLFDSTYASCNGDATTAENYSPKEEALLEQLMKYGKKMNRDLEKLDTHIEMADGSTVKAEKAQKKTLVVIVPVEAESNRAMKEVLQKASNRMRNEYEMDMDVHYSQEALI